MMDLAVVLALVFLMAIADNTGKIVTELKKRNEKEDKHV